MALLDYARVGEATPAAESARAQDAAGSGIASQGANRPYQVCVRCVMDTSDPEIAFDGMRQATKYTLDLSKGSRAGERRRGRLESGARISAALCPIDDVD